MLGLVSRLEIREPQQAVERQCIHRLLETFLRHELELVHEPIVLQLLEPQVLPAAPG